MSISKRPGSPFWYARFMVNGKRVVRSTGTADKRRAQQIEAKWKLEAFDTMHLKAIPTKTLSEAVERYRTTVLEPQTSPAKGASV